VITLTPDAGMPTSGACAYDGYTSICPSSDCVCYTYSGAVRGRQIGVGTATVAITEDDGYYTPPGCAPLFGLIRVDTNRDSENIDFNGSRCDGANGSSTVLGGWGISQSASGVGGWGTFSGPQTGNRLVIRFSGQTYLQPPQP
jgi:hypothetical protein